jgi:hypothetical protein
MIRVWQIRDPQPKGRASSFSSCAAAVLLVGLCALIAPAHALAQLVPLHQRIDQQVAAAHVGPMSPVASDAEFIRRVYLDLIGIIPSAAETRAFLADPAADKRAKLIDKLLTSPSHARHMANVFDVMLMERRAAKYVPAADWQKYLYESFLANKPYDVLAREILSSDGTDPATRPAAKFMLERNAEPNLLTRDVGRIFFGRDLQCAQCHDHPNVDDYYQIDYYGLYAFFSRTQLFTYPDKDKKTVLMDNASGDVAFQSVFDSSAKGHALPRVPGGQEIDDARFNLGEEWQVAPAKDVRHEPKYSRRKQLAAVATASTNRHFSRNIVNRLWAHMLGRGLVEPVDLHHSDNPPTHPQLLEMLADDFVATKYDMRSFLRELALSATYQRSLDLAPPDQIAAQASQAVNSLTALEAEQTRLADVAAKSKAASGEVATQLEKARHVTYPLVDESLKVVATAADAQKGQGAASAAFAQAQAQLVPKQETAKLVAEAAGKAKEASAKLPDDKDLAAAATLFQARTDQLNAELAPLVKDVEAKAAATKAAAEKLAGIQQTLNGIYAQLDTARKQVGPLEEQAESAAFKARTDVYLAKLAERRLAEAKSQTQFAAALTSVGQAKALSEKLLADLNAAKAAVAKLDGELPARQAALAAAEKANQDAQTALASAKQTYDAKEAAKKQLAELVVKAEAAMQKLPADAELAQTVQKLKVRAEHYTNEAGAAQKDVVVKEEATKSTAAQLVAATQVVTRANEEKAAHAQSMAALDSQLKSTQQKLTTDALAVEQLKQELPERWSRAFATHPLRQLSPEQFGWSILQATGVYENYIAAARAELEKATPLTDAIKNDPTQLAARQRQIEEAAHTKLAPNMNVFIQLFGAGAGQPQSDFFATVDQALFLTNGGVVKGWLAPSGENLTARLLKLEDAKQLADELYLSVLSRLPSEAEAAEVGKYLASRPAEKPAAVQELAWSLLSSAEFRFNH